MPNSSVKKPKNLLSGDWESLLRHVFIMVDDIAKHGVPDPFWTFGGGTVLMLRYQHRLSKDVDIFVPDPQYLGFVTPRLSDVAAGISTDYVESTEFVKLIRPEGEIDFVASPNLTEVPFEHWLLLGRIVRVETAAEIVAKKLWHRGNVTTARDLFDLSLVIDKEPEALKTASQFLIRHADVFVQQIERRAPILKVQFEAINTLAYNVSYEVAAQKAALFLQAL